MASVDTIDEVLSAVVERLAKDYKPQQVILYGSYAYGTADKWSDLDLFIVKEPSEFTSGNRFDRWNVVKRLLSDIPDCPPVHAEVYTPKEVEGRLEVGDQFLENILDDGLPLFGYPSYRRPRKTQEMLDSYAREWLRQAEENLVDFHLLFERERLGSAFQLQQVIEKCLKAYLLSKGWNLARTHNLSDLLTEAETYHPPLERYRKSCAEATLFQVGGRYPQRDDVPDPLDGRPLTIEWIRECYEDLANLMDWIRNELAERRENSTT